MNIVTKANGVTRCLRTILVPKNPKDRIPPINDQRQQHVDFPFCVASNQINWFTEDQLEALASRTLPKPKFAEHSHCMNTGTSCPADTFERPTRRCGCQLQKKTRQKRRFVLLVRMSHKSQIVVRATLWQNNVPTCLALNCLLGVLLAPSSEKWDLITWGNPSSSGHKIAPRLLEFCGK